MYVDEHLQQCRWDSVQQQCQTRKKGQQKCHQDMSDSEGRKGFVASHCIQKTTPQVSTKFNRKQIQCYQHYTGQYNYMSKAKKR